MEDYIIQSIETKKKILQDKKLLKDIEKMSEVIVETLVNDRKLLFVGNGGSASDCDHLATEFVSKFFKERKAFNAISLASNNALITALSNDFGYEKVFSRQIEAIGKPGDILFAFSTSGKSKNIIEALKTASMMGLIKIGFTGITPCEMDKFCDILIKIPAKETSIIQESHMMLGHVICKMVEDKLFSHV
ncbi:MAG TPA: SIS domain-containing protein [Candidatus Gastranaerophilaceae bacterium]|nr:SIS domain-containing protein [Candidatus Gastranaerophilaceae bacterium]HPT40894.1 SIS domain-containing protein [Candidatus Gastranaerophilaceae bacterium]